MLHQLTHQYYAPPFQNIIISSQVFGTHVHYILAIEKYAEPELLLKMLTFLARNKKMNVLVTTVYTPIIKLKEAWVIILQSCVVLRPLMSSSIAGHTAHIAQRGSTGSRQPFDPTQPTHDASAMPCHAMPNGSIPSAAAQALGLGSPCP
jgi:hypothetical protein